ncbi:MAG: hypothetical protein EOP84_01955 [Verrucomicrobiaceae bacterium]|nr:MAG: hypothetical protein EOP84_01955 [Verrucomicrobiaceae bacterium]
MRALLLTLLTVFVVSCEDRRDDSVQILIDVYAEGKPMGGAISASGEVDSEAVGVYLDGSFIGTTPLSLTNEDLKRLGLPSYEQVDISSSKNWMTWDTDGNGAFVIAHPEKPNEKQKLEFRTTDKANPKVRRFEGLVSSRQPNGAIGLFPRFTKRSR